MWRMVAIVTLNWQGVNFSVGCNFKNKTLFKGYAALVFLRGNCFLRLEKGVGMCWQRLLNRHNGVCYANSSKC